MSTYMLAGIGLTYCVVGMALAIWMMTKAKDWDR